MFHTLTRSILPVALATAVGAISLPADARTTVAFAGRANNPDDAGCFSEWFGTMKNTCGSQRYFTVPLTTDAAGYHSITVSAYGASSNNNVGCRAFGVAKNTTYYGSAQHWLSTFGATADIALPAVYVPGGGSLFTACDVKSGGQINLVNFTW